MSSKVPMKIGTHNGTFHCDEALAVYMLKLLPEYKDAQVVRTRSPEVLKECDIVVDVGAEYDPSRHRYDHHQKEFAGTMSSLCPGKPWQTRLSSAGLVYLHFGRRILTQLLPSPMEDQVLSTLYDKIYENLIEEVDAVDNGISTHDGEPRYRVTTTLSARVKRLNPGWNEPLKEPEDSRFQKAVELVGEEFTDRVQYFTSSWLPARSLVQQALERRMEVDPSGEIMELAQGGCPWQDHLFSLESESGQVKYLIFPDTTGSWRVQAVPIFPGSFNLRKPLKWCGLRGEKLSEACGIPGCIFVHVTGFIGGHSTREGALALAKLSLS